MYLENKYLVVTEIGHRDRTAIFVKEQLSDTMIIGQPYHHRVGIMEDPGYELLYNLTLYQNPILIFSTEKAASIAAARI